MKSRQNDSGIRGGPSASDRLAAETVAREHSMSQTESVVYRVRTLERLVQGRPTSDGAGVKLTRVFGNELQRRLDPFLMLDVFANENPDDYMGGFPDHPHRGFETVTYMLAGAMRHRDSAGNEGLLGPGGAQWMTAGSGLVHSELPEQEDGLMEGFQLWLNLPAHDKMTTPSYRDIPASEIPEADLPGGGLVRVLAGEHADIEGAVTRPVTEPLYLDVHLPAGARFERKLAAHRNAFAYIYRGAATAGEAALPARAMAVFANDGDGVELIAGPEGARFLLVAGNPLHEPIVSHGPFVMNTQDEIMEAFADYRAGLFEKNVPVNQTHRKETP